MMPEPGIALRPSAFDRAWACPASHHPAEWESLVYEAGDSGPATLGTAIHEIAAEYVRTGAADTDRIADKYGLSQSQRGEIPLLYAAIREAWSTVSEMADDWQTEITMHVDKPFAFQGTADVVGRRGSRAVIVDWKSGRKTDASHEQQIRGYALARASLHGDDLDEVTAIIVWLRDWDLQIFRWSPADLREWAEEFRSHVWEWDGVTYLVGDHCSFCHRAACCPGRRDAMASATTALMNLDPDRLPTAADLGRLWDAIPMLEKACAATKARIKEAAEAAGELDLGDGRRLTLKERNGKPDLGDAEQIADALPDWTGEDLMACATFSITALRDAAAAKAPRGEKAAARKELEERLIDAGAMKRRTHKVAVVEKIEEITSDDDPDVV